MGTSTYTGGLGTRDGGDLVRWQLDITDGETRDLRTLNGTLQTVRISAPEAKLILYSISREESIAVIEMLNEMRSAATGQVIDTPSIGNRFSGLEFD